MTVFALTLVLAAAFCHATWNFHVKRINGGPELIWLISVLSNIIYLPIVIYILWLDMPTFSTNEIFFILVSSFIHLVYFIFLQKGYKKGDLSLIYPLARSTGPLVATAFAVIFLGEEITPQIAAGVMIIIFGILSLTGAFKQNARHLLPSILFGLATGFFIGSYTAWDAYVVSILLVSPILLDYVSNIFRTIILAPVAYRRKNMVKGYWKDHRTGVILIGFLSPLAYILFLYALTFTPVTLIAPVRETSVLISVLMGSILLGEGNLKRRLIWSSVTLFGVVLLATA